MWYINLYQRNHDELINKLDLYGKDLSTNQIDDDSTEINLVLESYFKCED